MSQDLLATVHQVLSSDDLEIQELVQRISSARSLDEETKDIIIKALNELSQKTMRSYVKGREKQRDKAYKDYQKSDPALAPRFKKEKPGQRDQEKAYQHKKDELKAAGKARKGEERRQKKIDNQGDAQRYYKEKGRAPEGWSVEDGKVKQRYDRQGGYGAKTPKQGKARYN